MPFARTFFFTFALQVMFIFQNFFLTDNARNLFFDQIFLVFDFFQIFADAGGGGMTMKKLQTHIKKSGLELKDILIMEIDRSGNTTIIKRDERLNNGKMG